MSLLGVELIDPWSARSTGLADTRNGAALATLVNCHIKWRLIYVQIGLQLLVLH